MIVGIDLGTTNCAVAFAHPDGSGRIEDFPVLQLVQAGEVAARATLPSFLYVPGAHELPPGATSLPWDAGRPFLVGELARSQGALVPGRLVASAKSWLCHPGVDRSAAILPWDAPGDVPKLAPVEVSARFLQHLREAWDAAHPEAPLGAQDIVLTVPASFDEVARELTVEAAHRAGFERLTLLEERQAAFYAWIHQVDFAAGPGSWRTMLEGAGLVLVCDVGGGTTDFTLISVVERDGEIALERTAVGDHLLLGGDNMDLAIGRRVERRLEARAGKLDARQFQQLTHACRLAKERLLDKDGPAEVTVTVSGRGARVIGGAVSDTVTRADVLAELSDGFFPPADADDRPAARARAGLVEWGLPFAADPAITRHLVGFLATHSVGGAAARPDAILFNGGALTPVALRRRISGLLEELGGRAPVEIANERPDLAVARGAAYYGLVRAGQGVRIGGGSARAFYVEVAAADGPRHVCVAPRGMLEGDELDLQRDFELLTNQPVRFHLATSSTRTGDAPGDVVRAAEGELVPLPPVLTVIRHGRPRDLGVLKVRLHARLTELGTLALTFRRSEPADTAFEARLEFDLRGAGASDVAPDAPTSAERKSEAPADDGLAADVRQKVEAANVVVRESFAKGSREPADLVRRLEAALGAPRDQWDTAVLRALWPPLYEARGDRGQSAVHEARWLNLAGYFLRPGWGFQLDDWRMKELWRIYKAPLAHEAVDAVRIEWWVLWRRVSGGLNAGQQEELWNRVVPSLLPRATKRGGPRRPPPPHELAELWRVAASLERLPATHKEQIGEALLPLVEKGKGIDYAPWALARVGARQPLHGPIDRVVPIAAVEAWIERLLKADWRAPEQLAPAIAQLGRKTGDRSRDIGDAVRGRLVQRLRSLPGGARFAQLVAEPVALLDKEQRFVFGDAVPPGLRLGE